MNAVGLTHHNLRRRTRATQIQDPKGDANGGPHISSNRPGPCIDLTHFALSI